MGQWLTSRDKLTPKFCPEVPVRILAILSILVTAPSMTAADPSPLFAAIRTGHPRC